MQPSVQRLVDAPFSCREKVAALEKYPVSMSPRTPKIPSSAVLSPLSISAGPTVDWYIPATIRNKKNVSKQEHDDVVSIIAAQLLSAFQKKLAHQSLVVASLPVDDLLGIVQKHATLQRVAAEPAPSNMCAPTEAAPLQQLALTEALEEELDMSFVRRKVTGNRPSLRASRGTNPRLPQHSDPPLSHHSQPPAGTDPPTNATSQPFTSAPHTPTPPVRRTNPLSEVSSAVLSDATPTLTSPVEIQLEDFQRLNFQIANIDTKLTKTRAQLLAEEEARALPRSPKAKAKALPAPKFELDLNALDSLPPVPPRRDGAIPLLSTRPEVLDLQLRREHVLSVNEAAASKTHSELASIRAVLGELKKVGGAESQWHAEVESREEQLSALEGQQAELRQILVSIQGALAAAKEGKEIPEPIQIGRTRPSVSPLQRFGARLGDAPRGLRGRNPSKGSVSRANILGAEGASPDPKRPDSRQAEAKAPARQRELEPETRLKMALRGGEQQVDSSTFKLSSNVKRLLKVGRHMANQFHGGTQLPSKEHRTSGRASDSLSVSRARHESVVSMAMESEYGGMLEQLDAYSAVGETLQKPVADMTEEDFKQLALMKECEGELRALVGQRDHMRRQLEDGEEELKRIMGHASALAAPRDARELAVELAPLLDRDRDSDADSSDDSDSDGAAKEPAVDVGAESVAPMDGVWGLDHEVHSVATQCDIGGDGEISGPNSESVAQFEKLFRSEKDLLSALQHLTVAVAHVLTFHWSMAAELTCRSCLQVFRKPTTVWPCGHVVCADCVFEEEGGLARCGECGGLSEWGGTPNDLLEGLCRVHFSLPFAPGEEHPSESHTYAALVDAMAFADVSSMGLTRAASNVFRRASRADKLDSPTHTTRDHLATLHELVKNAKEKVDHMHSTVTDVEVLPLPPSIIRRKNQSQVTILPM